MDSSGQQHTTVRDHTRPFDNIWPAPGTIQCQALQHHDAGPTASTQRQACDRSAAWPTLMMSCRTHSTDSLVLCTDLNLANMIDQPSLDVPQWTSQLPTSMRLAVGVGQSTVTAAPRLHIRCVLRDHHIPPDAGEAHASWLFKTHGPHVSPTRPKPSTP